MSYEVYVNNKLQHIILFNVNDFYAFEPYFDKPVRPYRGVCKLKLIYYYFLYIIIYI